MAMRSDDRTFDAIVIGSGMGGLSAAAALAKCSRRVLVLEKHFVLGGLTQTFNRHNYTFATGVHYIGGAGDAPGPENQFGRMVHWLTDGQLRFASIGSPYDIVRLPGFDFPIEAPLEAYIERLKASFPNEVAAIDTYFAASNKARRVSMALFAVKALPALVAAPVRWFNARRINRALGTTTAEAVREIRDPRLAAVLAARWGDYGVVPTESPFAAHALVTGSYYEGAYYPVGGPAQFAKFLGETVTAAGGKLRTRANVAEIRTDGGRVIGVRLANDELIDAPVVISAIGAHNTVNSLPDGVAPEWRNAVESLKPSISYMSLFLGLHGDIRAHGASTANVWIYESNDVGKLWEHPAAQEAPSLFVSFPSLKDPSHRDPHHHTAEIIAICRWEPFSKWARSVPGARPDEYETTKAQIAETLLAQFKRHFPQLGAMVEFYEVSTPLTQASFVMADQGAMYGLEISTMRMSHNALRVRTPVPGLLLAGQDVVSPGIQGAFMGGFMAAASIEPRLWRKLNM
jgi:all-trans-retinol 13,14-reductase